MSGMYGQGPGYRPRPPSNFGNDQSSSFQGAPAAGGPPGQWRRGGFGQGDQGQRGSWRAGPPDRDFQGPPRICNMWRNSGKCSYGESCRYYHEPRPPFLRRDSAPPGSGMRRASQGAPVPMVPSQGLPSGHRGPPAGPQLGAGLQTDMVSQREGNWGPRSGSSMPDRRRWDTGKEHPYFRNTLSGPTRVPMGHAGPPAGVGASGLGQNPTPMLKQPMVGMARMAPLPQTPAARKVVDISMLDRVRAVCCLLGVGDAGAMVNSKPGAMQAAVAAIKSGATFRENLYADGVETYIP